MNNNYNANLYLTTNDLNSIENKIELLTNKTQEKVFNNQQSPLRNVQVGDNLNNKTIYMFLPRNAYELMTNTDFIYLFTTDNGNRFRFRHQDPYWYYVDVYYNRKAYTLYNWFTLNDENERLTINVRKIKLPDDFGVVTSISSNNNIYQYIKIYENENILPNYDKHIWTDNEVLSMQKIDNIETGIKNIGTYYYRPTRWISNREWLKTSTIENKDNDNSHTKLQNISYQDLNRWVNNLSLIDFEGLAYFTIWNTNHSIIIWNEESEEEWIDNFKLEKYTLVTEHNDYLVTEDGDTLIIYVNTLE